MFHNQPAPSGRNVQIAEDLIAKPDHEYIVPVKAVKVPEDMQIWEKSEAYFEYLGFVLALNEAVTGKANSLKGEILSPVILNLLEMLDKLDKMIDDIPPIKQPQRFGNQAFRSWYQKLKENAFDLVQGVVSESLYRAVPEILFYLIEGFGNATRIDYGTGHEMSFVMFLYCLFKIGALVETDKAAVPCKVFAKYLNIVRKLQQTYRMEPAGSHGVWSLDDYQFIPFIWGSAQLISHSRIEPSSFLQPELVERLHCEYLFLGCIKYINHVKTGPFAEHSNQLWGISGVASWSKINSGLVKMYKAEVLGKFPVVQHILFGSLLPFKIAQPNSNLRKVRTNVTPGVPSFPRKVPSENLVNKDSFTSRNIDGEDELSSKSRSEEN
ncbi:hypothetical protein FQR65_LT12661 [Abscondita terminalis]|nr:hypothetical protein FQR65_LT12661 [Abscondita terminalis]